MAGLGDTFSVRDAFLALSGNGAASLCAILAPERSYTAATLGGSSASEP